jgi:hypothetical protein
MDDDYHTLASLEEIEFDDLLAFYWDQLRADRAAPRPWEFDTLELPNLLHSMSIYMVIDEGNDALFKFVGQSLVDRIGQDPTGFHLTSIELGAFKERFLTVIKLVVQSRAPVVSKPRVPTGTLSDNRSVQVLALPLMEDGQVVEVVAVVSPTRPSVHTLS